MVASAGVAVLADTPKVGISTLAWWAMLGVASICLSHFFNAAKLFTLTPDLVTGANFVLMTVLTLLAVGYLIYDGYAKDKASGKLVRTFFVFEWLFAKQYPDYQATTQASSNKEEQE